MKKVSRLFTHLFVAAASVAAMASAQAQNTMADSGSGSGMSGMSGMYGAGRGYIGLSAGQTDYSLGRGTGLFGFDRRTTAYSISTGSYFSNNFGVEIGYTDFGNVNRAGGTTKADGINLSLIAKLPLGESFNLLGKLGTTYGRTDVSSAAGSGITSGGERGFGVSYGIGAEFMFNPQWSAVLQYDEHDLNYAGGGRERINVTSLGARYRF